MLPVTVVITCPRALGKLLSGTAKPYRSVDITDRGYERAVMVRTPVKAKSGIGARRAARLAPYGIRT